MQRQLRWLGHVIRLPDNRLPRRLLYGELSQGQSSVGRPKKRFSDYIRITLQKCNIQLSNLDASASGRDVWRTVCEAGLNNFMNGWISDSMKRRAACHASTAKPKTGLVVPAAADSVPRISDYAAIFDPTHLLDRTILSSATLSSIPTDFSSSSTFTTHRVYKSWSWHCGIQDPGAANMSTPGNHILPKLLTSELKL